MTRRAPYQRLDLEQGTQQWLEFRQGVIGASDAPVIMGENPWKTAKALLREKQGAPSPFRGNAAMREGTALEPVARRAYQRRKGVKVEPAVLQSTRYTWQAASLDGIDRQGSVVVEIKCGHSVYRYTSEKRRVPSYYYGQLQHILCVAELDVIDFWVYLPNRPALLVPTERDESYIERLVEAEERFWTSLTGGAPLQATRRRPMVSQTSVEKKYRAVEPPTEPTAQCPDCSGSGLISETELCARCGGYGRVEAQRMARGRHRLVEPNQEPSRRRVAIARGIEVTPVTQVPPLLSGGLPWWVWVVLLLIGLPLLRILARIS